MKLQAIAIGLGVLCGIAGPAAAQPDTTQGRYLATAADCAACHTAPGASKPFAGGYGISTPLGTIFSTNITPSQSAGIGTYSEAEFARAIRQGVAKDGHHLYPVMPYTAYAKLSDADVAALYAYFIHDVAPVDEKPPQSALAFPFNIRASMAVWNLMFLDSAPFKPNPAKPAAWNRGAYLAEALEHCATCHTPRNAFMAEDGSAALGGGSLGSWYAPNITADPVSGIGGWSDADLTQYLRTGHAEGKAQAAGPMAEAVEHSLQHLTDGDLQALVTYLKQTAPISNGGAKPRYAFGEPSKTEIDLRGSDGSQDPGWRVFSGSCANCHQDNGTGTNNGAYPSLYHNTATGADRPDNLVSTILFGVDRTVAGKTSFMPAFGPQASFTDRLSDQAVADVSNYVFSHYGNPVLKISAADVATIRAGGPPPLLVRLAAYAQPAIAVAILALLILAALGGWLLFRRKKPAHA